MAEEENSTKQLEQQTEESGNGNMSKTATEEQVKEVVDTPPMKTENEESALCEQERHIEDSSTVTVKRLQSSPAASSSRQILTPDSNFNIPNNGSSLKASHPNHLRHSKKQLSLPELESMVKEENKRISDEVHIELEEHRKKLLPIRERIRRKHEKERDEIEKLFEAHDTNNSGRLEVQQLKNLLFDLSGEDPSDQLVMRILLKADPEGYYHLGDPSAVPSCGINHILDAITSYKSYLKDKVRIDEIYSTYDWNHSGKLEREQVAALMKDMNNGISPSKDDLEWILLECDKNQSGGIDQCELLGAIALWADMMQETANSRKNSAICTVS